MWCKALDVPAIKNQNMKYLFSTIALCALLSGAVQAQESNSGNKKWQAGVNAEIAYPLQNKTIHTVNEFQYDQTIKTGYSIGLGASIMGRYLLNEKALLTASLGYINFFGKSGTIKTRNEDNSYDTKDYKTPDFHSVPLRLGAEYLIGGPLFAQGEIGAAFGKGATSFLFAPGLGLRFNQFELEGKYEGWSNHGTFSFVALRLGYFF